MNAIGLQQAIQTLPQLIQHTLKNAEETLIVSDMGAVVLIDHHEWEHLLETLRLLQDKTSLNALLEGHKARDEGQTPDAVTVAEAFYDVEAEYSEKCQSRFGLVQKT